MIHTPQNPYLVYYYPGYLFTFKTVVKGIYSNQNQKTEALQVFTIISRYLLQSHAIIGIALLATKTQKLVSGHAHNSLIHISPFSCHVVFRGLVVFAIASEGRDTEFESHLKCLLRDRDILRIRRQSATRKNNKSKVEKRTRKL